MDWTDLEIFQLSQRLTAAEFIEYLQPSFDHLFRVACEEGWLSEQAEKELKEEFL
jgi:hypothetical protein